VTSPLPRRALRTTVIGLTSLAVAGAGTLALTGVAAADPNDLDAVRARVASVTGQVDELYHQAEVANERYLAAKERLRAAKQRLAAAENAMQRQGAKVEDMTRNMGGFAAAAYRQGVVDPTLQMVLSDDPGDALTQSALMDAFADQQATALAAVAAERNALAEREANVEEQAALLTVIKTEMAQEQESLQANVEEAEALLDSLQAREREILAEIEAQQELAAQRRAEAAERAARDEVREAPSTEAAPVQDVPATGSGAAAARFALAQVGDWYAYGGTGPSAWDCSGLTSGAWAAAGVGIPRTSQAQLYGLPRVSPSAVQPGDIIVYYSGASHVGIYIGNGQIVHASRPGIPVTVAPMYSMPVVGAVRPG
jgi:peptidoglycan DL-endopeptidase CwlO